MKRKLSPEKSFEKSIAFFAKLKGMMYIKIPDPIMTKDRLLSMKRRGQSDEFQRPCDGILVTHYGNYLLEFKYNYNKLLPHQTYYQNEVNKINHSYYVIRKINRKKAIIYRIECNNEIVFETLFIDEIIEFFKEL